MMPDNNQLSSSLEYGPLLPPDSIIPDTEMIAYQQGGIALNDASQGLQVQLWTLRAVPTGGILDPVDLILWADTVAPITILSVVGVTSVSLAFDQNMQPAIAYVANGRAKLYWFDTTIPGFTTIDYGTTVTTPRVVLDDKRGFFIDSGQSSIILGYISNDNLCIRDQHDRFTIEYVLQGDLSTLLFNPALWKIQMNDRQRLQFLLRGNLYA